jgi:hypothetical protein
MANLTNALLKVYTYSWLTRRHTGMPSWSGPDQPRAVWISRGPAFKSHHVQLPGDPTDGGPVITGRRSYSPWNILIAGGSQPPPILPKFYLSQPNDGTHTNPMAFPDDSSNWCCCRTIPFWRWAAPAAWIQRYDASGLRCRKLEHLHQNLTTMASQTVDASTIRAPSCCLTGGSSVSGTLPISRRFIPHRTSS